MKLSNLGFLSGRKIILIMVIGLIVFALYFYFNVEAEKLLVFFSQINSSQLIVLYLLALGLVFLSVFFWAIAWQSLLEKLSIKISAKNMFLIYWAGYFVDLVVPLERVGGDLLRVYLLHKQTKAKYSTLASSAVTYRLVSYFVVIVGLVFASVVLVIYEIPAFILGFFFFIFAVALIYFTILLYLALDKRAAQKIAVIYLKIVKFVRREKNQPSNLEQKTQESLARFYLGFQPFRKNYKLLLKPLMYHTIAYVLRIIVYVMIFFALGIYTLPFAFFVAVYFVGSAVQDAIGSFSVGSIDILLVTLFVLFGLDTGVSGVAALLLRGADFWFPLVVALICLQIIGVKNIAKVTKQKRKQKKAPK